MDPGGTPAFTGNYSNAWPFKATLNDFLVMIFSCSTGIYICLNWSPLLPQFYSIGLSIRPSAHPYESN